MKNVAFLAYYYQLVFYIYFLGNSNSEHQKLCYYELGIRN
jgi:hypothetical protein